MIVFYALLERQIENKASCENKYLDNPRWVFFIEFPSHAKKKKESTSKKKKGEKISSFPLLLCLTLIAMRFFLLNLSCSPFEEQSSLLFDSKMPVVTAFRLSSSTFRFVCFATEFDDSAGGAGVSEMPSCWSFSWASLSSMRRSMSQTLVRGLLFRWMFLPLLVTHTLSPCKLKLEF